MKYWDIVYYRVRQRCRDKNRPGAENYVGRGIKCLLSKDDIRKLWVRDRGHRLRQPSIDRIDVDGHYEYSNCRFIELSKNAMVRRNTLRQFCPQGHPYSGDNLYMKKNSMHYKNRICKKCASDSREKYYRKLESMGKTRHDTLTRKRGH